MECFCFSWFVQRLDDITLKYHIFQFRKITVYIDTISFTERFLRHFKTRRIHQGDHGS